MNEKEQELTDAILDSVESLRLPLRDLSLYSELLQLALAEESGLSRDSLFHLGTKLSNIAKVVQIQCKSLENAVLHYKS